MDIELNKPVVTTDGEEIGTVDRLIVEQDSLKIREFVVQQGTFLSSDKIVDVEQIANVGADGTIHLKLSQDQVDDLNEFVESRYVKPSPEQESLMPQTWAAGAGGHGALFWGPAGPGRGYPGEGSMFEPAPSDPPPMEPATSVDQTAAVLAEGVEVLSRDGDSVGTIQEVHYNANGEVTAITVEQGWISKDRLTISMDMVDAYGPEGVKLSATKEEAEKAGTAN